jgi:hypothetical protein
MVSYASTPHFSLLVMDTPALDSFSLSSRQLLLTTRYPNLHYTISPNLHPLAYLRNLSHRLRQFRQNTRITQHGQTCHRSMRPIRFQKRMKGTVPLQVSLVNVGDTHDNFGAKETMGSLEGWEGGTRIED